MATNPLSKGAEKLPSRYTTEFKLTVVGEIESGQLTANSATRKYNIGGKTTVNKWLRSFGKGHLIGRDARLEMSKKLDRETQLKEKNRQLEAAVADMQLKILALESLVEVASEHYGENLKKNFGSKALERQKKIKRR